VIADLNWDQHLAERAQCQLDASTQRVNFGQNAGVSTLELVDYNYYTIAPAISLNSSERNKLTLSGALSRYNSIDSHDVVGARSVTESRSASVQIGFVRQLTELWTLTALGGYSRALNEADFNQYHLFVIPPNLILQIVPVSVETSQNGTVYAAGLTHKGSLLELDASASRQLTPSGFAFLSRQEAYAINATYSLSERWSFSAAARLVRYQNPPAYEAQSNNAPTSNVYTRYFTAAANWHWTEHWTISVTASRVSETVQYNPYDATSNEIIVGLTRQFDPITF
jgi:outer membrane receptor protein involved in Fe transport